AAMTQFKLALKLEPALFRNNFYQVQNLFAQANKFEELVQLLDEIDLRKVGNYSIITEPIASLLEEGRGFRGQGQGQGKELGLKLFRKAWEAFPQNRSAILGRIRNEELWKTPEIYQFAKDAIIPREDSEIDPWQAAMDYNSYSQDGRMEGILTRLLGI